jgi:ankyrin repeat protein
MIRPRELQQTRPITLPSGEVTSTDDLWTMLCASRDGDLDRMRALVSRCPGLVRCEYNYTPPLHFAVREGHLDVVRYLLAHRADLNYHTYPFGDSLVTMAEDREHREVAQVLLDDLRRRFPIIEGIAELMVAAREGNLVRVRAELDREPNLARGSNDTGNTALHLAAEGGHLDVVMLLLDAGANVDAVRADGLRPINCALKLRGSRALRGGVLAGALLARGAAYNIYLAALLGDIKSVRDALAGDPSLANFEDTSHHRPISAAAQRNDLEMVKLLLDHGANLNLAEEGAPDGQALWTAVYQRQSDMVRILLEHGANPNTAPESSGSALFQARGDPELTRLLIEHGAHDESGDLDELGRLIGDNALAEVEQRLQEHKELDEGNLACWGEGILAGPANRAHREMLALLIRHGARVPEVSKWGRYYYFKHLDIAAFLLEKGMNPNHMNWQHVTLLHDMAHEGDVSKARLLLDHGADIDPVDEEYRSTPLGLAARWGQQEMVAFLLERGADPNKAGARWATPLAWARKKGHAHITTTLLQAGAR